MRKNNKKRRLPKPLSHCRDCGATERIAKFLFFRPAPPRCTKCGGLMERAIHLNWAKKAESPVSNLLGSPRQSTPSKADSTARYRAETSEQTKDSPTGNIVAAGLVLSAAAAITVRGHYSLIDHAKEAG